MANETAPSAYEDLRLLGIIDALAMNAALLDAHGVIQATNRSWRDFAVKNGGAADACGRNASYLDVCAKADASGSPEARTTATAIRAMISSGSGRYETTYPCHSPTEQHWFLLRIVPLGSELENALLVTHEDVTDRMRAQQTMELQRSNLQMLLETSTDGIHVTDELGRVRYFSDSFASMLGYRSDEMLRLSTRDWEVSNDGATFAEEFARLKSNTGVATKVFRRKDGGHIHVEVNEKSILLDGQMHLYRSARDITNLLLDERQKMRDRKHLQELERINRELDDFVYVASHDLRSPLRAVTSLAQWIIEDDRQLGPETGDRLHQIQNRAQRMTQLLDSILLYARAGKTEAASGAAITAEALVVDVVGLLNLPAGFRVLCDSSLAGAPVLRVPLEQVLHNLIGNAVKHHDRADGVISVVLHDAGSRYRFVVSDDGPGIPLKYRESVFEMFTTLKPRDEVEGSGMGLALVRKLVRRLGGDCGIEPMDGRGTRFWFDWPKPVETVEISE